MARASRGRRRRTRERVRGMSEGAKRPSESAGEGVAETRVRLSRGRLVYPTTIINERIGWGGCGPIGARVRGHLGNTLIATDVRNRLGRVWPNWCPGVVRSCLSRSPRHMRANRRCRRWHTKWEHVLVIHGHEFRPHPPQPTHSSPAATRSSLARACGPLSRPTRRTPGCVCRVRRNIVE